MAKLTLLDMVQSILNDMDGDQVNSIDDTFESEQVAVIVRDTFRAMIDNRNWPHLKQLVQLTSSGLSSRPTHVTVPENVKELLTLNYNKVRIGETRKSYSEVKWMEPDDFLRLVNGRNNDEPNVDVISDSSGVELLIINDFPPSRYTSFDDETIVMDSYDNLVETTIQESKIQARAVVSPTWSHSDTFIPDLPEEAFTALLEKAKARAMLKLKQVRDVDAEQESARQQRWLSRKAFKVKGGVKYDNYGRLPPRSVRTNPPFDKDS